MGTGLSAVPIAAVEMTAGLARPADTVQCPGQMLASRDVPTRYPLRDCSRAPSRRPRGLEVEADGETMADWDVSCCGYRQLEEVFLAWLERTSEGLTVDDTRCFGMATRRGLAHRHPLG
jgi:hypothetical protein